MINHTFPFAYFSGYDLLYLVDNVDEEYEYFSNSKSSASGCCLAFAYLFCQFHPGVAYNTKKLLKLLMNLF